MGASSTLDSFKTGQEVVASIDSGSPSAPSNTMAFTQYLMFFFPNLDRPSQVIVKVLFVIFHIVTNVVGTKAAGKTNDVLTLVKLVPLIFFTAVGL